MQYDPVTGETPSSEDRRRDPWSSSSQSPVHGQPGQGWQDQAGQQPGATDPRMPVYPAGQGGGATGPVPPPGYAADPGGRGYDYGDQAGMPPGRSVFDVPSGTGEYGPSAPTGEYAIPPTGEYAQPSWQPPAWTGSDPLARGEAPAGGWSASPAGGWDTGQQQPYAGPPTQAWATGEQQAWQTGERQAPTWQTGEQPAIGYERGAAQDYGQGYGASDYGHGYGSGYRREDQDYGQALGSPQGQQYGGASQGYGQGYGREGGSPPYEQPEFGQAGDPRSGYGNGYGQGGFAGDAQPAGAAYQVYDAGGDRFGQPGQPADAWGEGSGYGATGTNGGLATQAGAAPAGAARTDAFSQDWAAGAGWAHAQRPGDAGAGRPVYGGPEPGRAEEPNGLARGALIAALVGLMIPIVPAIVALILAAKASRRISESGGAVGGRGMVTASRAIAGVTLALGAISLVLVALILPSLRSEIASQGGGGGVYGPGGAPASEPTQRSTEPGTARIVALKIGDCIANTPKNQVTDVKVVSCADKHETEVFANVKIDDASLPSEQALDSLAKKRCVSAFNSYVGKNYNDSVLNIRYFTPTEDSWAAGDRSITCTLTSGKPGGKLTGSKKGTAE